MKYLYALLFTALFWSCNNPPEIKDEPVLTLVTYPNPSRELIRIYVKNDIRAQFTLQIFDPEGEVVYEGSVPEGDPTNDFVISVTDFGTGAFHAVLRMNGSVYTKKFMVL